MSKVCCLILNYNDVETTIHLLDVIKTFVIFSDILIVDNCSTDASMGKLTRISGIDNLTVVQTPKNGGYGSGNNFGIRYAYDQLRDDYVLLCNPDVLFSEELVGKLVATMENNENVACATAVQLNVEREPIEDIAWRIPRSFEYAVMTTRIGRIISKLDYSLEELRKKDIAEVECVPGALLLYDAKKFLEVGGYDEDMFLYCEEVTIGYKFREQGYKTLILGNEYYVHEHSVSINKSISSKKKQMSLIFQNRLLFMKKYLHSSRLWLILASALQNRRLRKLKE